MSSAAATVTSSRTRRNPWRNGKLLIAGGVLLAAVAFLVFNAMGSSMAYFVTVGEMQASGKDLTGQQLRVGGHVEPGSIARSGFGDELRFSVTDGATTLPVVYNGTVPDIFKDDVEVVVEGTMRPDGTLEASSVLTKCPSKFEAE
ncbi:MAG: cytochrome C biogenesis protein CycJ [Chloroflexi bacterium]|nr:MAG: cytochrome C biogenesis protein CycJ [Chloroflexota bacterium]